MKRKKRALRNSLLKKEGLDLREQFLEAKTYLHETRNYIYFSIVLFFVSGLIGFLFNDYLTFIDDILRELILKTQELSTTEMVFFIMQNNMQSSFLSILAGILLGFFPIVSSVSNGVILGYVLERSYQLVGLLSWWRLLPHGVFELPAIFISFGLGLKLGFPTLTTYWQYYMKKSKTMVFLPFVLAIISFFLSALMIRSGQYVPVGVLAEMDISLMLGFNFVWSLVLYCMIFILVTYIFNPQMRMLQDTHLRYNFYHSMNVFLMIILPLLVVAAVIEGLLIGLVS